MAKKRPDGDGTVSHRADPRSLATARRNRSRRKVCENSTDVSGVKTGKKITGRGGPNSMSGTQSGSESDSKADRVSEMISLLNPLQLLGLVGVKNPLGGPPEIPIDTYQEKPRGWYVYAHEDASGSIFYIGKGVGKRAWAEDGRARHEHWYWYVEKHLHGRFRVEILRDNLDEDGALLIEDAWMSYLDPDRLINWANYYRTNAGDPKEYAKAFDLREKTNKLVKRARELETKNLSLAVYVYLKALKTIDEYAPVYHEQRPKGLVGMISDEISSHRGMKEGMKGDVIVLDRLTLCLKKLGQNEEAAKYADEYLSKYVYDAKLVQGITVQKRVNKLIGRKDPDIYPTFSPDLMSD